MALALERGQTDTHVITHPYELPGLPETAEFTPGSERTSIMDGSVAVTRAGWGEYLSTDNIINQYRHDGTITDLLEAQLRNTGFNGGYRFHPDVITLLDPHLQNLNAGYAAKLATNVVSARGWDHIHLYIGTSTMTSDAVALTKILLERAGIEVRSLRHHSLACQSWSTALLDSFMRPELHGENVVDVGMDTLSPMTDPNDPIPYVIFGNGGGAAAYIPGQDMELLHATVQAEHDEEGITTCVPITYLPPKQDHVPLSDIFVVKGQKTPDFIAATHYGLVMYLPPSGDRRIWMNGRATLEYFVIGSNSFELIENERDWYNQMAQTEMLGPLGIPFGHQPSREVVNGLNNYAAKRYKRGKLPGEPMVIPWVMDQFNNTSAGTGLIAWEEMIHRKLLKRGSANPVIGIGIGSTFSAGTVYFY